MKKATLTEKKVEQTPSGGALVGKRQGQTIIHNKGTLSGYLVGKTHAEGGIKAVNKSTGQALEMQGGEVVITAPAVSDTTKNEFNGKMMTNREILSTINEKGGGVSFAKGGDVPKNIKRTGASYKYGGKTMTDHEIYKHITGGHLADGMTLSQIAKKHKVSLKELQKQVDLGMKAESEHTSSKREQMKIVKDHLFENPKYYTLLKRAGLKHGGRVYRGSLVRDSKRGNTPARDLNNYNDVLDIDADGIVGAETGLFDDGGAVKEVVEYITIGSQSENPFMDEDKMTFYSFISFKDYIRDIFEIEGITNKRLIFLCINNNDSFTEANINISKGKNTNKNFNPFTGSFDAFFKNIADKLVARKYDWDKWGGVKTSKTTPSQTSKQIDLSRTRIWIGDNPALSEKVQKRAFELGWGDGIVRDTERNCMFFREDKTIVILKQKYSEFEDYNTFKEIFESDLFPTATASTSTPTSNNAILVSDLTLNDLSNSKIWFGNNPELSEKIQKKAFSLGLKWIDGDTRVSELDAPCLVFNGSGNNNNRMEKRADKTLFNNVNLKEIFVTDTTPTSVPFNLKQKKIWIGYNPALSKKIQERAIQLGFDWWGGDGTPRNLEFDNLFFDINEKITSGSDRANFDSFADFEEITEADLFPTSTASTSTSTPTSVPFDLSNTKIFVGNDIQLKLKVLALANAQGFKTKSVDNDGIAFTFVKNSKGGKLVYGWNTKDSFDTEPEREIFESDLFPTSNSSQTSVQNTPVENEDWVKKFTADLDKLVTYLPNDIDFAPELSKERKDLENLKKLLPSFQQSKYAVERAKILKEIKKLHYKLTYEGFIKPNEALSSDANLFTPQGLLDYYFTQATQNPTADLEPACELITPNGEKSKLPLSAYLNVRTPQFKNWFGDWEKAYETGNYVNCSKMIDPDTKEPKIYFHGVRKYVPNFGQFSNMGQGVTRPYGAFEPPSFPASYFAGEEDYAKFYGGVAENMPTPSADYKPFIYKVFLSVKNPISLLPLDFMLSYKDFMDYIYVGYGVKVDPNQELLKQLNNDMTRKNPMWIYVRRDIGFIEKLKDYGYDAIFQMGDIPTFLPNGQVEPDRTKHLQEVEYLTFYPSQVKSATVKKSFYFDFFNDIRFKNGGYVRI